MLVKYNKRGTRIVKVDNFYDFALKPKKRRVRATAITYRAGLFRENVFYFGQGGRCQNLKGRKATHARWKHVTFFFEREIGTTCDTGLSMPTPLMLVLTLLGIVWVDSHNACVFESSFSYP